MAEWLSTLEQYSLASWLDAMPSNPLEEDKRLLLTANQRLSRSILQTRQTELGVRVIASQGVLAFESWRSNLWLVAEERGLVNQKVIQKPQERFIWQQLLADQAQADTLLADNKSLAKALSDARSIREIWSMPLQELELTEHKETLFFLSMAQRLYDTYISRGWITPEQQTKTLIELFNSKELSALPCVGIYGFTELNPLQVQLLEAAGDDIVNIPMTSSEPGSAHLMECPDWQQELELIAGWAHKKLQQNPDIQLGIVIPNLQKHRAHVDRVFTRQFDADYILQPQRPPSDRPYELSIGSPLAEEPIVADALLLTQLIKKQITKEEALEILRSVFWGRQIENPALEHSSLSIQSIRNRAIQQITDWQVPTIQIVQFIEIIAAAERKVISLFSETGSQEDAKALSSRILAVIQNYRTAANKLPFQHWTAFLKRYLKTLNWPGDRTLNSREFQAVEQFKASLDELREDQKCILGSELVSLPTFLTHLKQRLSERVFQQQSPRKPIQITGTIEALGLSFDACWVANVTRSQFPEPPQPNPFLPIAIQKKYDTPRNSAQKEQRYAETVFNVLSRAAPEIIFSYSLLNEEEHQQASPLLPKALPADLNSMAITASSYAERYALLDQQEAFFVYHDSVGLPLADNAGPVAIKRGVSAIGAYALNPLYAYLIHRLGAKQPNGEFVGISPQARGNILHNVLEVFWQNIRTHEELKRKFDQPEQLEQELITLTEQQVNSVLRSELAYLPEALITMEKQRCTRVLLEWLTMESERSDFRVLATEQAFTVVLDNVSFSIRVDRVDQLVSHDGQKGSLLIDYKTGSTPISTLQKAPLVEPQLPIYTHIQQLEANAVAIGHLKPNECAFVGIGDNCDVEGIKGPAELKRYDLPNDWASVLKWWQEDLSRSVYGLTQGVAQNKTSQTLYESRYSFLSAIVRADEQDKLASTFQQNTVEHNDVPY